MKNYIILIISVLIITSCQIQQQEVKNHPFVTEFINSLNDESKTLILEFWAPSCGSCIKLKNDIFENDQNINFLKENFLLVKVSPSDLNYKSLFKYYNLNTQSSVLFFNKQGVEIERSVGYNGNKESYIAFLKDINNRKNLFVDVNEKYLKDTTDILSNYLLANKLLFRYENQEALKHFNYIIHNDVEDALKYQLECKFRIAEIEFLKTGNIDKLIDLTKTSLDDEFAPQVYLYLINYYKSKKDHKNSIFSSAEALYKFPHHPDLLNKHAWNIYLFKIKEDLNEALEMTKKAININPNVAGYWDTQAWIYFELGMHINAIESEKKAIELFPHQTYKNALNKFISDNNKTIKNT